MSKFKKKNLQTANEAQFFQCLQTAFPNHYVAAQVALSAIVDAEEYKDRSQFRTYYADYIICDKSGVSPLLVVELDDTTHNRKKRIEQDQRKNGVLFDAQIPLYRFTARRSYDPVSVCGEIEPYLSGKIKPPEYPRLEGKGGGDKPGCLPLILLFIPALYWLFTF